MGRIYAGILGPLAMTVIIVRGAKDSAGIEGTLTIAIVALTAYAILGAIVGRIAQATVDESVRWKIEQQLATAPAASSRTGSSGSKTE